MGEQSFNKPLLSNQEDGSARDQSLLVSWTKWILKILMWAVFISWLVLVFLYPSEFGNKLFKEWTAATKSIPFGITGSMFLAFSGPVLVIAVLAVAHVALPKEEILGKKRRSSSPRFRLWTFPVLVDGPSGVVSAAEFLGIVFFAVFLLWAVYAFTMRNLNIIAELQVSTKDYSILLLQYTGVRFGMIGLLCMTLLFLPITRGSILLRLIDIPFEHATRYHVWLGHVTMVSFTIHGLSLVIGWCIQGRLAQELLEWKAVGISRVPGAISLLSGLLMWVTSLGPVRKRYFELFFYTHQLYMVFIVFLALHVGDFIFSIAAGGIFLYMLDRFLRFCQSRKTVDVLSAKSLPSGTVELVLSKPANLQYSALSFIFLQVRELSWLQWHPFSVSSSPLDGKYHITVLIKVLGGWTAELKRNILRISEAEQEQHLLYPKITASVEGPYGHKSHYHLMYENLILVAGGIGISPFFAILRDIFNRIRDGKHCLTRKILVVWAIKNSEELDLLSTVDIESIYPSISNKLKLDLHIYVTQQSEPPLEEGMAQKDLISTVYPESNGSAMSVLVDAGENIWTGLYVISSIIGLFISLALLYIFYINKFHITVWWYKGLLFVSCMIASVLVFGGLVVGLWHLREQKTSSKETSKHEKITMKVQEHDEGSEVKDSTRTCLEWSATMVYGRRPDFREIFRPGNEKWDGVDVGVIACGPKTLQASVAKEIRSHNLQRAAHHPIFHFNCHSFDL